jgi:hypothetical protein
MHTKHKLISANRKHNSLPGKRGLIGLEEGKNSMRKPLGLMNTSFAL